MRNIRPGRILEASLIGLALLLLAVVGGGWIDQSPVLRVWFDRDGPALAWFVMGYGFVAATLPVWLLLAPRDYLSTFLKLGTVALLAVAIVVMHPELKMPALTRFVDGTGPIFAGKLFRSCSSRSPVERFPVFTHSYRAARRRSCCAARRTYAS